LLEQEPPSPQPRVPLDRSSPTATPARVPFSPVGAGEATCPANGLQATVLLL